MFRTLDRPSQQCYKLNYFCRTCAQPLRLCRITVCALYAWFRLLSIAYYAYRFTYRTWRAREADCCVLMILYVILFLLYILLLLVFSVSFWASFLQCVRLKFGVCLFHAHFTYRRGPANRNRKINESKRVWSTHRGKKTFYNNNNNKSDDDDNAIPNKQNKTTLNTHNFIHSQRSCAEHTAIAAWTGNTYTVTHTQEKDSNRMKRIN